MVQHITSLNEFKQDKYIYYLRVSHASCIPLSLLQVIFWVLCSMLCISPLIRNGGYSYCLDAQKWCLTWASDHAKLDYCLKKHFNTSKCLAITATDIADLIIHRTTKPHHYAIKQLENVSFIKSKSCFYRKTNPKILCTNCSILSYSKFHFPAVGRALRAPTSQIGRFILLAEHGWSWLNWLLPQHSSSVQIALFRCTSILMADLERKHNFTHPFPFC